MCPANNWLTTWGRNMAKEQNYVLLQVQHKWPPTKVNRGPSPRSQVWFPRFEISHAIAQIFSGDDCIHRSYDPLKFECLQLRVEAPNVEVSKRQALQGQTLGLVHRNHLPGYKQNTILRHQALSNRGGHMFVTGETLKFWSFEDSTIHQLHLLGSDHQDLNPPGISYTERQHGRKHMFESPKDSFISWFLAKQVQHIVASKPIPTFKRIVRHAFCISSSLTNLTPSTSEPSQMVTNSIQVTFHPELQGRAHAQLHGIG